VSGNLGAGRDRPAGLKQLLGGFVITLISVGMLLGSFLLSQLEASSVRATPTRAEGASRPSATPSLPTLVSPSPTLSPLPTEAIASPTALTSSVTPTSSDHLMPSCPQPVGWSVYNVQVGDTLPALAWRSGMTTFALMQANCLSSQVISPGQRLYVPPTFYATATPKPYTCGPPLGWTYLYRVQPGDTLYSLSRRFGVGIEAIRQANCLDSYQIKAGRMLYMPWPPLYTSTPTPTATPIPPPTSTATPTPIPTTPPPTLTYTPEVTLTPTATLTPTLTFTLTPTPTLTFTPTPTLTPTETPVPPTSTPTPTFTPETPTSTPEPPTPTETPIP
jgi:LysM repeat protein